MMYLSLLILVYFSIFSPGAAQEEADPEFCTVFDSLTEVTKEETQVEAISTIIDDIAPGVSEALQLSLLENVNHSNSSMPPLQVAYNTLAESFDARPNVAGYNKFVEAVNEISLAQAEACNNPTFVPTIELVTKLAGEFENATFGPEVDLTKARSAFGKLLCLNTREGNAGESVRKRRQTNDNCDDVTCLEEARTVGLSKVGSVCEFFVCLQLKSREDIKQLGPVFGFASATATNDECLAFIVDTTGSMSGEIDTAKQTILNFIASEDNAGELQCYVLVPFNDYDRVNSSRLDYGPITVVYTRREIGSLVEFVAAVNNLEPTGGGDIPEYATDGMLAGLRVTIENDKSEEITLMTPGSQMIVLTDAPTKNEHLEAEIITEANQREVCVHFLIARNTDLVSNSVYQRIAEGTSGTIEEFSDFTFSDFVASFRQNPCDKLVPGQKRKRSVSKRSITRSKRQVTPEGMCKNFYVSSFAYLLKLSIEVNNRAIVSITQPNGTVYQANASSRGLAVFSQAMPTGGQWKACVNYNIGRLEVALSQDIAFDTSVLFINEGSEMPSTTPPPLCTSSRIALLSLQADNIAYASLTFVSSDGNQARRINLFKCKTTRLFVSDIVTFSEGTYNVELSGHDIHGVSFTQTTGHTLTFDSSNTVDYELASVGEDTLNFDTEQNETLSFSFRLHNPSVYSTSFQFASTSVRGFDKVVTPISAVVPGRKSVDITFTLSINSESGGRIRTGSSYKFTLFASNGCASYSASKIVVVTN